MTYVTVYGGAFIDTKWRAVHNILECTSSVGIKSEHFGGVGRNIAEGLKRLGVTCSLVSRVGNDEMGRRIIEHLKGINVNTDFVTLSHQYSTPNYCAFFHKTGELFSALTDFSAIDELTKDLIAPLFEKTQHGKMHVADTDLPDDALNFLSEKIATDFFISVTCVPSVEKLCHILEQRAHGDSCKMGLGIEGLFLNHQEFIALSKKNLSLDDSALWAQKNGVKNIFITLGKDGVFFANNQTRMHVHPKPKSNIVDVTGAGDSFLSGCLAAYYQGLPLEDAVEFGMKAASLTLESPQSVSPRLNELVSIIHERSACYRRRSSICLKK